MKKKEKIYKKNKDIVTREIDGELILMPIYRRNKDINKMYVLNEMAAKMWELIDGKRSLNVIAEEIEREYDITRDKVKADLLEFVDDMKTINAVF